MAANSFADFYRAIHGEDRRPFPWQQRLADMVLAEGWPTEAIAVPTGCGKTSTVDIAIFALAVQAGRPALERTAPLRTFFVIDRRLVVDDVYRHVCRMARKIAETPDLEWARKALNSFGGRVPLETAVLRGGMYRSDVWADLPNQPLVCVSTVDQVGSRLLFRGYGTTDERRPVDAGLMGNDSLFLIDEAHLSTAFLDTLGSILRYQGERWREHTVAPGLRFVRMSATPNRQEAVFGLQDDDYQCETLSERLKAEKPAELKDCIDISRSAAEEASKLSGVVGVVLNTVGGARSTYEALNEKGHPAILLTGRVRPYERDGIIKECLGRMKAGRVRREGEHFFVVATQTIEVGADLDFDNLVTEAAPIDSLRQRFGRLNRLGKAVASKAVILKPKAKDIVYGDSVDDTWKWLKEHAGQDGKIDFGIERMNQMLEGQNLDAMMTNKAPGPLVFPAHLDAWAQTNPAPAADPDVAPFLHGRTALDAADVQIVWRADLEDRQLGEWKDLLEAAPPLRTEGLPLSFAAAKKWLQKTTATVTDIEGAVGPAEEEQVPPARAMLIWRGPDRSETDLASLRPGDTVIVRSSEGGCDRFGWAPGSTEPVKDIGDLCANERAGSGGGKYRLRIYPDVLFPSADNAEQREDLRKKLQRAFQEESMEEIAAFADERKPDPGIAWGKPRAYGSNGAIVTSLKIPKSKGKVEAPDIDESDKNERLSRTVKQSFNAHTAGVLKKVKAFVEGCGVEPSAAQALVIAAGLHDIGKCDPRFQYVLNPQWTSDEPWMAKGDDCSRAEYLRRLRDFGYPAHARHEFVSVALAEADKTWANGIDCELVLHLIGTHHGHGRAMAPVWEDGDYEIRGPAGESGPAVCGAAVAARLSSGWTDRYWAMTRKYGWWGLAYLEAILRRADCVQSREEQE